MDVLKIKAKEKEEKIDFVSYFTNLKTMSNTDNSNHNNNNNNNNNNINESQLEIDGELIAQGAEAKIYKSSYENKATIVKYRFPKKYRHKQLDLKLRKNRSKKEQKCINKARCVGICVPNIYYYDNKNCCIHMEFIDLPTVKSVLIKYYDKKTQTYDNTKCINILKEIGKNIAILHKNDLVHGDLTTSNMLINENKDNNNENKENDKEEDDDIKRNKIVMIDFGLSEGSTRTEDKAVDIYVLERALLSTHPKSQYMIDIILNNYKIYYEKGQQQVLKRLDLVRLRGRKRSMIG